jgi:hypothetical protein
MKKRFSILTAFLLILLTAIPAFAAWQDMSASVMRWSGNYNSDGSPGLSRATTGITYKVFAVGTKTAETLYAYNDRRLTAKTNAVTTTVFATDKQIAFKVDPTDATYDRYVDLIVTDTVGGYTTFVKNFDKYTHTVVIDERPNVMHHGMIGYAATTTTLTSTGITFVADTMIHDVRTEVTTGGTAATIGVGLYDGSATGFLAARSIATAGYTADTGVITAGSTIDYTAATTYGALLYTAISGSDAVASNGGRSYLGHIVSTTAASNVLAYTASTTSLGATTGYGQIHFWFTRMR